MKIAQVHPNLVAREDALEYVEVGINIDISINGLPLKISFIFGVPKFQWFIHLNQFIFVHTSLVFFVIHECHTSFIGMKSYCQHAQLSL